MSDLEQLLPSLERSRTLGFLGPGPVLFHVEHAVGFLQWLPESGSVLDLGSGGGLPGLVLAAHRPDLTFLLLDAQRKRCEFLEDEVQRLGWNDRVSVRTDRAELAGREPSLRGHFSAVVSRSFGPPAVVAECAAPFLVEAGRLVVSEPPDGDVSDDRWPTAGVSQLGLADEGRHLSPLASYRVLTQQSLCPEQYPRRNGLPAKRPLF